jgi:hypothetical protein
MLYYSRSHQLSTPRSQPFVSKQAFSQSATLHWAMPKNTAKALPGVTSCTSRPQILQSCCRGPFEGSVTGGLRLSAEFPFTWGTLDGKGYRLGFVFLLLFCKRMMRFSTSSSRLGLPNCRNKLWAFGTGVISSPRKLATEGINAVEEAGSCARSLMRGASKRPIAVE